MKKGPLLVGAAKVTINLHLTKKKAIFVIFLSFSCSKRLSSY